MYIKKLTATFGRLENDTLELQPGLNIIYAPNEGGKSTWTAFLKNMLFGLNSRDRSPTADKRRYLPWSGSPMQGTMELTCQFGDVTITRRTSRANAPMGSFSAVYSGTAEAVKDLTAADCGEKLLGVPLDVFERSAYIRQSGIAVDQSAALEQRIAALITTGEEDTSYSAASARLKKQLTRRRYNRSGILPQLEQEIRDLRETLLEMEQLRGQTELARAKEGELSEIRQELLRQLELHDQADAAELALEAQEAKKALREAGAKLETLQQETKGLPGIQELEALMGSMDALALLRSSIDILNTNVHESETVLARAQAAAQSHPLGGHTPEQAHQLPLQEPPRPGRPPLWQAAGAILAGAAMAGLCMASSVGALTAIGAGLGLMGLLLLAVSLPARKRQQEWDRRHDRLMDERQGLLKEYYILYNDMQTAQEAMQRAAAARTGAQAGYDSQFSQVMAQVSLFRRDVRDPADCREAVAQALERQRRKTDAKQKLESARLRWELLSQRAPDTPQQQVTRPSLSRDSLREQERTVARELDSLRQQLHTSQGRIQALGDPDRLRARLEQLDDRREQAQLEYDAISLAMDTLEEANSQLQSRFSPALGEKSANFFTKLTKGKYNKVLLDRTMSPSAQEDGQFLPREAALLSQGAADQLYLAVRLAICEMVLPEEDAAPILLDDALVTFDDQRCAAALELLAELGKKRQILLFTCQKREQALLEAAGHSACHFVTL